MADLMARGEANRLVRVQAAWDGRRRIRSRPPASRFAAATRCTRTRECWEWRPHRRCRPPAPPHLLAQLPEIREAPRAAPFAGVPSNAKKYPPATRDSRSHTPKRSPRDPTEAFRASYGWAWAVVKTHLNVYQLFKLDPLCRLSVPQHTRHSPRPRSVVELCDLLLALGMGGVRERAGA